MQHFKFVNWRIFINYEMRSQETFEYKLWQVWTRFFSLHIYKKNWKKYLSTYYILCIVYFYHIAKYVTIKKSVRKKIKQNSSNEWISAMSCSRQMTRPTQRIFFVHHFSYPFLHWWNTVVFCMHIQAHLLTIWVIQILFWLWNKFAIHFK